jgi:hypothetical protein
MALSLDGHAATAVNTTSASVTLTTTGTDDLIVALTSLFTDNTTNTVSNSPGVIVSGGGLLWALRSRTRLITSISSLPLVVEEWVAHATAALTSQTITATISSPGGTNYLCLEVFGVSGADVDAMFDTNASIPAVAAVAGRGGTSSHTVSGISTTNANTFEIARLATAVGGSGSPAADAGFTVLDNSWFNTSFGGQQSEYKINSSTLSSVSQNVFSSVSAISANYISHVDAIVAAGAARLGPKFVNSGGGSVAAATSITPALPGSRVNGNLLLGHCSVTSATDTATWPAGWNVIENWTIGSQNGSKAWRYVDGTETAPHITWTNANGCMAQVIQISGVDQTNPIGNSSHNSASSTSVTCSTIATSRANSLVVNYLDAAQALAPLAPVPYRPRSSGTVLSPARGSWQISDEFLATLGSSNDSVNETLYASCDWLNFTTEILAPNPAAGSAGGAALLPGL